MTTNTVTTAWALFCTTVGSNDITVQTIRSKLSGNTTTKVRKTYKIKEET